MSVRRTVWEVIVTPAALVTGATRPAVSRAVVGSVVDSPNIVWPGATRNRSVPRLSISAIRSARLDAEIPTTATMAAIPMAIPRDVNVVRKGRERNPTVPTRNTSASRSRLAPTEDAPGAAMDAGAAACVRFTPPPPRCP